MYIDYSIYDLGAGKTDCYLVVSGVLVQWNWGIGIVACNVSDSSASH